MGRVPILSPLGVRVPTGSQVRIRVPMVRQLGVRVWIPIGRLLIFRLRVAMVSVDHLWIRPLGVGEGFRW